MKTIELNILAEDIKTTSFTNGQDCAITRALKRAGLDARHTGFYMVNEKGDFLEHPEELANKVVCMYIGAGKLRPFKSYPAQEPQDFTYSLEVPDNWVEEPQGRYTDGGKGFINA